MLLKYFYDDSLAHASYLVGCQRENTAVIVDPGRDVEPYLKAAEKEELKIVAIIETHIHADYVSGARELADRLGVKLYVSDEGPPDWKYTYVDAHDHRLLKDGDTFQIGKIQFEVLHTPGHTPESISLLLTDQGGGATEPMGIFTGDFVFVGAIGRPDLLETAAGMADTAEAGARDLYHSIERFKNLHDHLQVWPAHGAGSACGKGLGAIPSSTVGYEKLFNPALQFQDENEFVRYILEDQPEAPKYFALMKRVNKEGPAVLGQQRCPPMLEVSSLQQTVKESANVVDLRDSDLFSKAHVPGTINIPLSLLANWAGWLLDYDSPTYLIGNDDSIAEGTRILQKIGIDHVAGAFCEKSVKASGLASQSYASVAPEQVADQIAAGDLQLVDVRSEVEWDEGHVPQAKHHFLGKLKDTFPGHPQDQQFVVHCRSGARSAIAASVLQAANYQVLNLAGGYKAWREAGLPSVSEREVAGV